MGQALARTTGAATAGERRRDPRESNELMERLIDTRTESWALVSEALTLLLDRHGPEASDDHIVAVLRSSVEHHQAAAALNRRYLCALQKELHAIRLAP